MIIDGIILATLVLSALIAFFRGFVREVLTLFGLAGALAAAYFGAPLVQPLAHSLVGANPDERLFGLIPLGVAADVGAFAAVFLAVLILLTLAAHAISHGLHAVGLGALDRTLGVLFGLVRGLVLVLLFYLPFYFTAASGQKEEWFRHSAMLPLVDMMAETIEPYLPKHETPKEKADSKEEVKSRAPADRDESHGFDKLDSLMRQALEPGQEPDVIPNAKPQVPGNSGYSGDQNKALDNLIGKTETKP